MDFNNFYALIIGVGDDLKETINDANKIKEALSDSETGFYKEENIFLLIEKKSTKENILNHLKKLHSITNNSEQSTVFIYYSGHGGKYDDDKNSTYYLKPYGSKEHDREKTMLKGEEFANKINALKCSNLFVLLDCCHAEGILKKKSKKSNFTSSSRELIKKFISGERKLFISSCDNEETSVILPRSQNSLFTELFIESLKDPKNLNAHDPFIRAHYVVFYILSTITSKLKKYEGIQQTPIVNAKNLSNQLLVCKNENYIETLTEKIAKIDTSIDRNKLKISNDDSIREDYIKKIIKISSEQKNLCVIDLENNMLIPKSAPLIIHKKSNSKYKLNADEFNYKGLVSSKDFIDVSNIFTEQENKDRDKHIIDFLNNYKNKITN